MTALPPNHAAVSRDYSAYLIRASINGPGFPGLHRRRRPNLAKLSSIKELGDNDLMTNHGEKQRQEDAVATLRFN